MDLSRIKEKINKLNKRYPNIENIVPYAPYKNWTEFTKDYIKDLKRLNKKGGEVVRFLFVGQGGSINKENLGDHYTIYDDHLFKGSINNAWSSNNRFKFVYETLLDDFKMRDEIHSEIKKPIKLYVVICKIPSGSIDFKESISEYEYFPNEKEVQLKRGTSVNIMNVKLLKKSIL